LACLFEELADDFLFVHLHFNKGLGQLCVEMILLNRLHHVVQPDRLFFYSVEHRFPVYDPVETTHDGGLY
jgi:hypothetical protein